MDLERCGAWLAVRAAPAIWLRSYSPGPMVRPAASCSASFFFIMSVPGGGQDGEGSLVCVCWGGGGEGGGGGWL